jgi:flavin reductase (DIM6/NTAB) family NADH-FMN oxidoreductase RutF
VNSAWRGKANIMTMGWHMVMEFEPSLIGCYIWSENHSFGMIRASKECVINIPTVDIAEQVVGIGNTTGSEVDKVRRHSAWRAPDVIGAVGAAPERTRS